MRELKEEFRLLQLNIEIKPSTQSALSGRGLETPGVTGLEFS
jgi:hypothetical protein